MAIEPLAGPAPPDHPTRWQQAEILSVESLTPKAVLVRLRPERWRPFRAGQHVDLRLTAPDGYQASRSYSIASAPEDAPVLELAVDLLPEGEVSPWFHEVAAAGDRLDLRGPFTTHFTWDAAVDQGPVLLVGGGSGVAPLMSMLRHHRRAESSAPMLLIHAARVRAEVLFAQELRHWPPGAAQVVLALSREAPERAQDLAGRLDAALLGRALAAWGEQPERVYVCGSNPFVNAVTDALQALAIAPERIRTERFGG